MPAPCLHRFPQRPAAGQIDEVQAVSYRFGRAQAGEAAVYLARFVFPAGVDGNGRGGTRRLCPEVWESPFVPVLPA